MDTSETVKKQHYLTLGQAAKVAGVSKSTISKALSSGKMSAADKTDAGYKIDPSELFRVFPVPNRENSPHERLETLLGNPANTNENSELRLKLNLANERLADKEKTIGELKADKEELKGERDAWREQAQRLTLPHPVKMPIKAENLVTEGVESLAPSFLAKNKNKAPSGNLWRLLALCLGIVLLTVFGASYYVVTHSPTIPAAGVSE